MSSVVALNLSGNAHMAPPLGFPLILWRGGQTMADGVIPKGIATVTATLRAVALVARGGSGTTPETNPTTGAPTVTMALFATPSSSGGSDGAEVEDTRVSITGLSATAEDLAVTVPSTDDAAPTAYIVRLWVTNLVGTRGVEVTDVVVS